jgi:integrase
MPLTDTALRNAKPRDSAYKLSDRDGLYLLVSTSGSKLWRFDYRFLSKRKTLALGQYPIVGLADARRACDEARTLLSRGVDPSEKRKVDKLVVTIAAATTFRVVAEEWLSKVEREGRAEITMRKSRWLLDLAYRTIGARPIDTITPPELLLALRNVEAKGHYESARRMRSVCGRVFRYGIATGRATRNPALDLQGALIAPKVQHHAAITDPVAIGALLRAIDGYEGSLIVRAALQLLSMVFVRPGELRHAEWAEFDLEAARWTIPAARMKMRAPHIVPLARQALVTLRDLQSMTGGGVFLFPSNRTVTRPISENTLNAALRRLGYGSDDMTSHGFRSMASTRLNEMGRWNPDAIERQLAHGERNTVRAAYNHALYLTERIEMMQVWADYLDMIKTPVEKKVSIAAG